MPRTRVITIKVSDEEIEMIKNAARRANVTVSKLLKDYARRLDEEHKQNSSVKE